MKSPASSSSSSVDWTIPVRHGVASHARKGEDAWSVEEGCYGVYDGHGGAELARFVAATLPARFMATKDVVDTFYDMDAEAGRRWPTEGTTATLAKIDGTQVVVAWVGDSRVISVDMVGKKLDWQSSIHNVSNEAEVERIKAQWRSRKARDEGPDLLRRATAYEARIDGNDRASGIALKRSQSFVGRRALPDGSEVGPVVVQSVWVPPDGRPVRGASTCVTRSIGDWDSSRALLPHADVVVHDLAGVANPAWTRYCIASDGLWDVVTPQVATGELLGFEDPQAAADALLARARRKYAKTQRGADPFKDDTTIVVFDVKLNNPVFVRQVSRSKSSLRLIPKSLSFSRSNTSLSEATTPSDDGSGTKRGVFRARFSKSKSDPA